MNTLWTLSISQGCEFVPSPEGTHSILSIRGGPAQLLHWLEVQLGLLLPDVPLPIRISQYASVLDPHAAAASYARSFATDRWATAAELLSRRDQIRMAGWRGDAGDDLPPLATDLAALEGDIRVVHPGLPERIVRVTEALHSGQSLPPHDVELFEPADQWPLLWRPLLAKLMTRLAALVGPQGPSQVALGRLQAQVLSGEITRVTPDETFRWINGASRIEACQAVVQFLAAEPGRLPATTLLCSDQSTAFLLDGLLVRAGLPALGAGFVDPSLPVLQVLSLALRLLWEPIDPAVLLDFLSLPVSPVPRRAARRLANALGKQPGYDSDSWRAVVAAETSTDADPEGELRTRLETWFDVTRYPVGQPLPAPAVAATCSRVAQWASGYAAVTKDDALAGLLRTAAGQAKLLSDLAGSAGDAISAPQLGRLLDAVLDRTISVQATPPAAGGPVLVAELSAIPDRCEVLVWLGLDVPVAAGTPWTSLEIEQLRAAGLDVDDGARGLTARRDADRRALARVRSCLFAVSLPDDSGLRPHPVWLQIRGALGDEKPVDLADAVLGGPARELSPWFPVRESYALVPPPPVRPEWAVDPQRLQDEVSSSATELIDRLGCPVKWMFKYPAALRSSPIATLPADARLKGDFCHGALAAVFGGGGDLPPTDEAVARIEQCFDESLPRNAAPLAQPWASIQKARLREALRGATRRLVENLHAAGLRILAMEKPVAAEIDGRKFLGYIDCLAGDAAGRELIVDFKYSGLAKYRQLLVDGRAVQLAAYAKARAVEQTRSGLPPVAYLVLSEGVLLLPLADAPDGLDRAQRLADAPAIGTVWRDFSAALGRSEAWLRGEEPVPLRPAQPFEAWPTGTDMVLDGPNSRGRMPDPSEQPVCRYCDYPALCGIRRLY